MSYRVTAHERAFVVRVETDRLDGRNSPALKLELQRLLAGGPATVVVDLTHVRVVDPNGLAALLSGERVAARSGGCIRVAGLCPDVHAVFAHARLDRIFAIFATDRDALGGERRR